MAQRPDHLFVQSICTVCDKPVGREFGGEVIGLASKEWLHLDCVAIRFKCPVSGKNCFDKPNHKTACRRCLNTEPKTQSEISDLIRKAADDD